MAGTAVFAQFGSMGWPELLIIGLIVLLLFGSRLPSVMRSLGRGVVEFKKGVQGEKDEIESPQPSGDKTPPPAGSDETQPPK